MAGLLAFIAYGAVALVSGLAALLVVRSGHSSRSDRAAGAVALAATALWALTISSLGSDRPLVLLAEIARNIAWIVLIVRMFGNDGRDESVAAVRPVAFVLGFLEMMQGVMLLAQMGMGGDVVAASTAAETIAVLRVLLSIGILVLLHNLFVGADKGSRGLLTWNVGGLTLLWGFELNFYTVAFLSGSISAELAALRAIIAALAIPLFAFGHLANSADMRFRPSRAVTFNLLSLGMIGVYLVGMVVLSQWVGQVAGDLARITQVGFLLSAAAFALVWLPSRRTREWLRVVALKHLFQHRYDYRAEWIRFNHTIGRARDSEHTLTQRAIQALGDITDSNAGLLLRPDSEGALVLAARWQWPTAEVPAIAMSLELARIFERQHLILDFDEARKGIEHHGELAHLPAWLLGEQRIWAAVPLLHHDRLVGVVLLARPPISRHLDWEDFDLLAIAGQQIASYLAEQSGQEALEEASRFDEFNRRMAFVMHDIKNLSSQMSLLLRNAEKHHDNPEFRKDMLVTLRSSADKLNGMLARLGRYGTAKSEQREEVDLVELAKIMRERFAPQHDIALSLSAPCRVLATREALDQSLGHLVQNAIDASEPGQQILVETHSDGVRGTIAVVDNGQGMSAQFVRNELFRPFVSSKEGGFGIGACEAREMVRAMEGRLEVELREGLGTRFTVSLPLASAAKLLASRAEHSIEKANEAA